MSIKIFNCKVVFFLLHLFYIVFISENGALETSTVREGKRSKCERARAANPPGPHVWEVNFGSLGDL